MALVWTGMPCAICNHPIALGERFVATSYFIGDANDPLWRLSDNAVHRRCYNEWPHRKEFARRHKSAVGRSPSVSAMK